MKKQLLVLGSCSPRRREMLKPYFRLKILTPQIDEKLKRGERPQTYVKRITKAKFEKLQSKVKEGILLTADTIVELNGKVLGKAATSKEARRMLRVLSASKHRVSTAVCVGKKVKSGWKTKCFVVHTEIRFRSLATSEVTQYIKSGEWKGKAGAYGIQGGAALFVSGMKGSLTNVIGLPLEESLQLITALSVGREI